MPVVARPLHDKRQLSELAFDMDNLRYSNLPMFMAYDDEPVKRLYAGGEFGSMYSWLYQGAGNVVECLHSRAAGSNAAAEEPWC